MNINESIKILQKRVEIDRELRQNSTESDYDKFCENECVAIENLIKGYRELEESHKTLSENPEWLKHYWIGRKEVDDYWKSKIREKIEELDKEEKGLRNSISAEEYAEYSDANISFDLMHIEIQKSILQEILEE